MNKKIEAHVNTLFANVSSNSNALEIKEELLANLNDKYSDLIESGKDEDQAFATVISSIGDINSLLEEFKDNSQYQNLDLHKNQHTRGAFVSVGVALYVLSIVPFFILAQLGMELIGFSLMFLICAVATGFVVYGTMIGRTNYTRTSDSFVEEYKEKLSENDHRSKLCRAASSSLWSFVVVLYLAISFISGLWHITWILFLIGSCVQQFVVYCFSTKEKRRGLWHGVLWTSTLVIYFVVSFGLNSWSWSWMLFLMAASVEQIIRMVILWRKIL